MNIDLLCVGHRPKPHEQEWIGEYLGRLPRYAKVTLHRFRETEASWEELKEKISPADPLWVLDVGGRVLSTEEFAALLSDTQKSAVRRVQFLIGGAEGLPEPARKAAHRTLSLSKMTLPHRIALLVLVEQLYRAFSFLAGEPYHRA